MRASVGVVDADAVEPVHHVVGALLRRGGRVLLVHRSPARRWYPDVWDVPGGHVEPGEVPGAALARELREELGIDAAVDGAPSAGVRAADFVMDVRGIHTWRGEPVNAAPQEHDAIAWTGVDDLDGPRLAPGVRALVQRAASRAAQPADDPAVLLSAWRAPGPAGRPGRRRSGPPRR